MSEEKKVSRRRYVAYAGAGVVIVAAAAAGGYYATRKPTPTPTPTVPATPTPKPTPTPTPTKPKYDYKTTFPTPPGETPKERAINGALMYLEAFPEAKGVTLVMTGTPGSEGHFKPEYFKEFTDATGLKVKEVTIDWGDIVPKMTAESVEKSGAYDTFLLCPQHYLGYFVEKGLILDPEASPANYYQRYQPQWKDEPPCPPPPAFYRGINCYKGKLWGCVYDYDLWTLHYRADLFEDPKEQKKFYDKYGYELRPPRTWKEYDDIAEFFTRPPDLYGTWVYVPLFWNRRNYKQILASRGVDYFDENMVPQIDSPAGIEAMEKLKWRVDNVCPPEAMTAIWDTAYDFFAKGKLAMEMAWASLKKYCEAMGLGEKVKNVPTPGVPTKDGRVRHASMIGESHMVFVNKYSKHPELAFALLTYYTDPEVSAKVVCDPAGFLEPFRVCHFDDPLVQKSYGGKYYTDVLKEAFDYVVPDINLATAPEYDDVLTKHVNAVLTGAESPKEGMRAVHDAWEEITERYGRDKLIEQLRTWGPPDHKGYGPKLAPLMNPDL
ncbi:MAG: extracellular solute-binding protein [Candidatus Bathyarchaeia archaeon]|nr:extracellular solute-binding protein [Candidatus Bathyarchaeota archaeon]